jgi:phosphate acetyltransferase
MNLLDEIKQNAKELNKKIVLPESTEERTLKAADELLSEGIAQIILIGDKEEILNEAKKYSLTNIDKAIIVNPLNHDKKNHYIDMMVEIRKKKGLTKEEATKLIENPLYLATLMIKNGDADGEVAGAENATGDVLRPAFQIVKTKPGISVVSGAFIMITSRCCNY